MVAFLLRGAVTWFFPSQIQEGSRKPWGLTTASCSSDTGKRTGYLNWDDYFMGIACLSAQRSKDPETQVGACIVNKYKRIVGTGYNGMPDNCHDDLLSWAGREEVKNKHFYVCHAEMNAIVNKISADVRGCTLYVTRFPCNECAKLLIQSGIRHVIYLAEKKPELASREMMDLAKVSYCQFKPMKKEPIVIDFCSFIPTDQKKTVKVSEKLGDFCKTQ